MEKSNKKDVPKGVHPVILKAYSKFKTENGIQVQFEYSALQNLSRKNMERKYGVMEQ